MTVPSGAGGVGLAFTGFSQHGQSSHALKQLSNMEPDHFVVPYLSKRKAATYQEDVRSDNALRVQSDLSFLAAKLSRLSNPEFPGHEQYRNTCKQILGFVVSTVPSANGQRPGIYLPDRKPLFIDQMGEGVPNIVGLLADLALSRNKIFLIEEPENDLHPKALKALLDLIIESSKHNQFVISTHSNIVVRHLASADNSKLHSVTNKQVAMPPEAAIAEVEPTVEARLQLLRDLGYSFSDFDLWDGWLLLEESSAERIIRDYLIPWFAPKLTRIRTLAAGGIDEVEPTFNDFHRLVRFTHLEEAYRNSTWVRVDGDEPGTKTINALKEKYSTWQPDRFACFGNSQFEHYYPAIFSVKVDDALSKIDKRERREAKRQLLNEVRAWLDEDEARGKTALEQSAAEVIADLKQIESQAVKH
ncbi:MAG TPA: AAA family ATPase [Gallionellaceae bacterium]|nr:AAA family ATPase [Gallionellaceae bacterium]